MHDRASAVERGKKGGRAKHANLRAERSFLIERSIQDALGNHKEKLLDSVSLGTAREIRSVLESALACVLKSGMDPLEKAEPVARLCAAASMLLHHDDTSDGLQDAANALSEDDEASYKRGPSAGTPEPLTNQSR